MYGKVCGLCHLRPRYPPVLCHHVRNERLHLCVEAMRGIAASSAGAGTRWSAKPRVESRKCNCRCRRLCRCCPRQAQRVGSRLIHIHCLLCCCRPCMVRQLITRMRSGVISYRNTAAVAFGLVDSCGCILGTTTYPGSRACFKMQRRRGGRGVAAGAACV